MGGCIPLEVMEEVKSCLNVFCRILSVLEAKAKKRNDTEFGVVVSGKKLISYQGKKLTDHNLLSDRACPRAAPPQPPAPQTAMPTVQAASSGAAGPAAGSQGALPAAARAAGEADQAAESPSSGTSADSNSSVTMAMENLTTQQASAAAPLGTRKMFTFYCS